MFPASPWLCAGPLGPASSPSRRGPPCAHQRTSSTANRTCAEFCGTQLGRRTVPSSGGASSSMATLARYDALSRCCCCRSCPAFMNCSFLCSVLPVPRNTYVPPERPDSPVAAAPARREPPPYGQRQGFIPRSLEDFGDGGAFPEIHVAQYPLDMGRKGKSTSTALVPVQVDSETGKIRYDALLNKGTTSSVRVLMIMLIMVLLCRLQELKRLCIPLTRT